VIRLLATFGEVERMGTSTREIERLPLSHDAVFPHLLWTAKRWKTSKRPRFTKYGQEPECGHETAMFSGRTIYVVGLLQV